MLRGFIVVLALVETAIFLLLAYLGLTESSGFRIMAGIAAIAAVPCSSARSQRSCSQSRTMP